MARNTGGGSSSSGGRKRSAPFSSASFHKTPSSSSTAGPSRREKAKLKGRPVKPLPNADEGDLDDADGNHTRTRTDKKGKKRSREEDIDPLNVYDYDPLSSSSTSKNKSSQKAKDSSNRFTLSKDEAKYVGFNRRKPYRGGDGNDGSDDDRGGGEDEDSDEEMVKRIKKAARTIAGEGSFKIRASSRAGQDNDEEEDVDGDDSDIDSDEAFEGGESGEDEEKWGDVFRKLGGGSGVAKGKKNMPTSARRESQMDQASTSKSKSKPASNDVNLNIDLSESELEDEDEDDEEAQEYNGKQGEGFKPNLKGIIGDGEFDEDEDDEEDEEEDDLDEEEEFKGFGAVQSGQEEDEVEEDEGMDEGLNSEEEEDRLQLLAADHRLQMNDGEEEDDEDEDDEEDDNDEIIPDPSLPSDDEDDMEQDEDMSDINHDPNDLLEFAKNISAGEKRKAQSDEEDEEAGKAGERKKRRVLISEKGPGGREEAGVFGAAGASKVTLASLIASDPSLKSSASILLKGPSTSTSILKSGTLAAPLPTIVQERLARQAAYEETKKEGDKWGGVMKRVKEAEYLRFPLQAGGVSGVAGDTGAADRRQGGLRSAGDLIGNFQPKNGLESAVTALLESANLREGIAQAEEDALEAADLTVEEVAERRAALRYERELLSRAETKSKRIAKIKSKTYRKLARKRAGKEMDLEDLKRLDPEAAEAEALKLETLRARERATLKHSSKSSRWAQQNHGAGETVDKRREFEDMLSRGEKLKRKIRGVGSDESEGDDSDEPDTDDQTENDVRAKAFDELARLKQIEEQDTEAPTGIMAMPFMQRALAKKDDAANLEEQELREQLEGYEGDDLDSDSEEQEGDNYLKVGGNAGRMVFSGKASASTAESSHPARVQHPSALSSTRVESEEEPEARPVASSRDKSPEGNPWLSLGKSDTGRAKKKNVGIGKDAKAVDKANMALKKAKTNKSTEGRDKASDDARVDIDLATDSLISKKAPAIGEEDDESSDDELTHATGVKAFKQRDLVAEAFAGDNVIEDFAAEKQRAVLADAPKEEDMTLPGWGSWGGKGVKKNPKAKNFIKVTAGIEPSQRKDFKRSNVIITEKRDKKASKYLPTDLPYPYTSAAQYEASFSTPVGADWNSRATHQRATMPRVTKKPGAIIEPVSRLF